MGSEKKVISPGGDELPSRQTGPQLVPDSGPEGIRQDLQPGQMPICLENRQERYAYMPFGQGPHNCIAKRFALQEIKLAMTWTLKRYTLLPSGKTKEPVRMNPVSSITYA